MAEPTPSNRRGGRSGRLGRPARLLLAALVASLAALPGSAAAADPGFSRKLPRHAWALSLDLRVAPQSSLVVAFGPGPGLRIRRGSAGSPIVRLPGGRRARLRGRRRGTWTVLHLQARRSSGDEVELAIGRSRSRVRQRGRRVIVRLGRGETVVGRPLVTSLRNRARLLLHRLSDLDARVPARRFLRGADAQDRLHYANRTWTRGFLAGALWQAGALLPGRDRFERAALGRSRAAFGYELVHTHDLGFVYENTSVAAYRRLCSGRALASERCDELRASAFDAAETLLELADTNLAAGTIPTRMNQPSWQVGETIIDSLINLPLLYWATRVSGDPVYREVAATHARRVARLLVRPDGSTAQSVHFDRASGRVLGFHTHQGVSASSTWARGQGWAVYGLTASAAALGDRRLLRTAERTAAWVAGHLPPSGVPPYDYDAPLGGPEDTSAGVITAAGALRLARLCERWPGACSEPGRWRPLGVRMLRAALGHVSTSLPLGYFGGQVGTFGGYSWDDSAELVYGLRYALEAVRLARRP